MRESRRDDRSRIDGSTTHIWPSQPYVEVECDDSVHEPLLEKVVIQSSQNVVSSPAMPTKPAIQPMDLDWECSPFSLGSPSLSSPNSTSRMLESPLHLDATGTMSSPAIYNSSVIGSHSPFNSPLATISNLMYSSRIRHMPGALTSEDLAIADLMRLEISATQVRAESTPVTQTSSHLRLPVGLGFEMPSPTSQLSTIISQPPQHEARGSLSTSSSDAENLIDLGSPVFSDYDHLSEMVLDIPHDGDLVANKEDARLVSPSSVGTFHVEVVEEKIISNERSENAGREFVGLGLEGLAGDSLQSSGSISRLYVVPSPSVGKLSKDRVMESSGFDNMYNGQYRSPGTLLISAYIPKLQLRSCFLKVSTTGQKICPTLGSSLHPLFWSRSAPTTSTSTTCRCLPYKRNSSSPCHTKPNYTKIFPTNSQTTTLTPEKTLRLSNLMLSWKKKDVCDVRLNVSFRLRVSAWLVPRCSNCRRGIPQYTVA